MTVRNVDDLRLAIDMAATRIQVNTTNVLYEGGYDPQTGGYRIGAEETAPIVELLQLRRDRDYEDEPTRPRYDFELRNRSDSPLLQKIKNAATIAAERARFR